MAPCTPFFLAAAATAPLVAIAAAASASLAASLESTPVSRLSKPFLQSVTLPPDRQSCVITKCHDTPGLQCYEKNPSWAACKVLCHAGEIDLEDPEEFQTPWSCVAIGPRTAGSPPEVRQPEIRFPLTFEGSSGGCPSGWHCQGKATRICHVGAKAFGCNHPGLSNAQGKQFLSLGSDFGTGSATSPRFILPKGIDRVSFMRSGGADKGSGLFVHAMDGSLLCSGENGTNTNVFFDTTCAGLSGRGGTPVFIRVKDASRTFWGKVLLDNIRLLDSEGRNLHPAEEPPSTNQVTESTTAADLTEAPTVTTEGPAIPMHFTIGSLNTSQLVRYKMSRSCSGSLVKKNEVCQQNVAKLRDELASYFATLRQECSSCTLA